jgi:hypothetical protein
MKRCTTDDELNATVSSSSTGFFLLRMKNELTVSAERVDTRESSMDVSSMWERVPVSSVSYCLRYCFQNCWRSALYGWYFRLPQWFFVRGETQWKVTTG